MDYYQLLGVSYSATEKEIKKSFRNLSKKYHPDGYPNASSEKILELQKEFARISEAYDTLSNENKKRKYDINNDIYRKRAEEQRKKDNDIKANNIKSNEQEIMATEESKATDSFLANYDYIKRFLDTNYSSKIVDGARVYFEYGKPVALCLDNIITMYFKCNRNEIWNHNDRAMVSIIKDAIISQNYNATICDVVMFRGMCGTPNTFKRDNKYFIRYDWLSNIDTSLGSVGEYYDGNFVIGEEDIVIPANLKYENDWDDANYGILNKKGSFVIDKDEYAKEWEKIRKDYDWFWNYGYNTRGSSTTRQKITALKYGCNYHNIYPAKIIVKKEKYHNPLLEADYDFDTGTIKSK